MKLKTIILTMALMTCTCIANAKYFFDAKSQIIGISGEYAELASGGFGNKFFENDIDFEDYIVLDSKGKIDAKQTLNKLNADNAGKKVLDFLFQYDGEKLSEEMLKDRAYQNRQLYDEEIALQDIKGSDALRENYGDVLRSNYIYFQSNYKRKKISWAVYHVEIDQSTWDDVFACWEDMQRYNQIQVKITLVASGKSKISSNTRNRLLRDISKKVPAFAIRGQVHKSPFGAYVGYVNGVWKNDRMYIYRQKGEGENARSVKVSTVRVTNTEKEDCQLYTIAGGFASMKKGDMAVLREDSRNNHSVYAMIEKNAKTVNWMYDRAFNYGRMGTSNHFLFQLGAGLFNNNSDYYYAIAINRYGNNAYLFSAPIIMQGAIGYGFGWTVLHRVQIMPYLLVQYEGLLMTHKKTDVDVKYPIMIDNKKEYETPDCIWGSSIRLPLGLKVNINIAYPLQVFAGAEYVPFCWGFDSKEDDTSSYQTVKECYLDTYGYKRTGLGVYAGIRVCF